MGFLSSVFGGFNITKTAQGGSGGEDLRCDSCGNGVDDNEMESGMCKECYDSDYTGPTYCCGFIYEDGEDTCRSCGESL